MFKDCFDFCYFLHLICVFFSYYFLYFFPPWLLLLVQFFFFFHNFFHFTFFFCVNFFLICYFSFFFFIFLGSWFLCSSIFLFFNEMSIYTEFFNKNIMCIFFKSIRGMRVNLYKLYFLSSHFSPQLNKIFFYLSSFSSLQPNTHERKLNFFYPPTFPSTKPNEPKRNKPIVFVKFW